jgi:hypothetical protein
MIRLSSADCANCSFRISSSNSSLCAISFPSLSIRFCNASIFDSVLSRNGALNDTSSGLLVGSLISSLRGFRRCCSFLAASIRASASAGLGLYIWLACCGGVTSTVEAVRRISRQAVEPSPMRTSLASTGKKSEGLRFLGDLKVLSKIHDSMLQDVV